MSKLLLAVLMICNLSYAKNKFADTSFSCYSLKGINKVQCLIKHAEIDPKYYRDVAQFFAADSNVTLFYKGSLIDTINYCVNEFRTREIENYRKNKENTYSIFIHLLEINQFKALTHSKDYDIRLNDIVLMDSIISELIDSATIRLRMSSVSDNVFLQTQTNMINNNIRYKNMVRFYKQALIFIISYQNKYSIDFRKADYPYVEDIECINENPNTQSSDYEKTSFFKMINRNSNIFDDKTDLGLALRYIYCRMLKLLCPMQATKHIKQQIDNVPDSLFLEYLPSSIN